MIFQTANPDWRIPFVLVLALLLVTNTLAQEPQSTLAIALQEQSPEHLPAMEGEPEVIRSIAALQEYQPSDSKKSLKVDLEAQLIFAAPYWTVFFVQDGDCNAMVWCTDATSWELVNYKVGCKLRIMGTTGQAPGEIVISSFEVTEANAPIDPIKITDLTATYTLPMNKFVELSSEVVEIYVSKHGTILSTLVGKVPVELEINDSIDVRELVELYSGAAVARGCLSLPPEPARKTTYVLRILRKEQVSHEISPKQRTKRFKVHSGTVVFSDSRDEFVVESDNQIRPVHSRFAFRLAPGDKVLVHELASVSKTASPYLESSLIEKLASEPLPESKSVGIAELLNNSSPPSRVSLTAKIESMAIENGSFNLSLTSENVEFRATIPEGSKSIDNLGVRVGDLVSLTGAPFLVTNPSEPGLGQSLKLYVASEADLKFVSTPTRFPVLQIAIIALVGCALLGCALTWNWLLRKQVQRRTARLNEVSSHLRKAFEAVNEGVLVNDCEQRISGFNQQFVNLFGTLPSEGESVSLQLSAIEDLLVNRIEFARIRQHVQDNKSPSTGMIELRASKRTLQVFASAITDNDGSYQGNLWSFEDITEKLSLENKLIQSQKMEAVGQLSGGIAHDFNNLLTIIRGSIMMMKLAANTNAPSTEFAESAEIAVDRAAELTQHLLDFSRRSTLQLQTIDANTLLKRVYLMIRRSIDSSIEIDFAPSPQPTYIKVDVTRLEQVLINMCINARDALPTIGGRIQLSVQCRIPSNQNPSNLAVIVVEDNGSGISPEVQKRMFEPFFTTKQPGCGTGLGLSMAIGVIEQLGGNIECRSALGKGTAFLISLPLANPSTSSETNLSDAEANTQPLRILLVDDEEQIRSLGRAILKSLGHQAVTAANGREALDLLAADPVFDVVLLDLTMPVMSGKEAFQEMRRRWPALPIAICSGYLVSVEDWVASNEESPPAILAKPYLPDELNRLLAVLTRNEKQE